MNVDAILAMPYKDAVKAFRQAYLRHQLERAAQNRTQAAKLSGIARTSFYKAAQRVQAMQVRVNHTGNWGEL